MELREDDNGGSTTDHCKTYTFKFINRRLKNRHNQILLETKAFGIGQTMMN